MTVWCQLGFGEATRKTSKYRFSHRQDIHSTRFLLLTSRIPTIIPYFKDSQAAMLWVQTPLSALLIAAFSSVCAHESRHVQSAPAAAAAPRQNLAPFNASLFPQLSQPEMSLGVPFRFRWPTNWPLMYLADDQEEYFHMRQNSQYKLKIPGPWYLAWIWSTLHVQSYFQTFHRGCINGR